MASKKYTLTLGLISLLSSAAMAQQSDAGYDWRDSSKIATKNLPQQSEFLNNQYPYPAKPRSMWELGLSAGNTMILGDIRADGNIGAGISLRKAISHTFSVRGNYIYGRTKGQPSQFRRVSGGQVSYQGRSHMVGGDLIASFNPASHYRGNPKTNIYALLGLDLLLHQLYYQNPANANPDAEVYNGDKYAVFYGYPAPGVGSSPQNGLITTLFGAEKTVGGDTRKGWSLMPGASAGAGIAFKLSKKINIGFEQRFTFVPYDYLDGYKVTPGSGATRSNDIFSYTSGRLNINIGSSAKHVEPLWWLNPNNFVYNEINRPSHMKLPPPVLPDADGDGVTDQFDMEPNTPAGVPVDVRGVAKDSDGDGVPDYKDKELLTPQKCFPVDADGVGNCPEPACCTELRNRIDSGLVVGGGGCNLGNLPSVQFRAGSRTLSRSAMTLLASAAAQIKGSPNCRIRVIGHTGGESSKRAQQLSWNRVNTVIRYLVEKQGISEDRLIFSYQEEGGDVNTVDLMGTTETGPSTVPAPHPNLR
ncbi:MAG: OmpA/MotB domain protein [Segetibacter sp.]|jgi:OOP family OmpA-OmpF porin|nr:OmpA/MotB domain protein [Segetibacter sp.]